MDHTVGPIPDERLPVAVDTDRLPLASKRQESHRDRLAGRVRRSARVWQTGGMQWGDVPAWVAVAISLVAAVHSWLSGRRAAQASAGAASLEVSLQRIADSLAAASRQSTDRPAGGRDTEASSAANPSFNVEFVTGHSYRLRNVGPQEVTNVAVSVGDFPVELARRLPAGVDLPPMGSTDSFVIQGSWQSPAPGEVSVACDQLAQPLTVPLPPRA